MEHQVTGLDLSGRRHLSISVWVKAESIGEDGDQLGIAAQLDDWDNAIGWRTRKNTDLKFENYFEKNGITNCNVDTPESDASIGQWHHLVSVFDEGESTAYLDGRKVDTGSCSFEKLPSISNNLNIGRWAVTGGGSMNGSIDDVRIYPYALTGKQVKQLQKRGGTSIR